jgi:hypothetical protein
MSLSESESIDSEEDSELKLVLALSKNQPNEGRK